MTIAQGHPLQTKTPAQNSFSNTLELEARELESLHLGLRRHLTAWRDAHDGATARLTAVIARLDKILAHGEHSAG